MDYRPVFPSQMGIKGRLWPTNVFQDGNHETHLVFRAVVVKECLNSGDFLTYFPLLWVWEREATPRPLSIPEESLAAASQPQARDPQAWGPPLSLSYIWSVFPPIPSFFLWLFDVFLGQGPGALSAIEVSGAS